MEEIGISIAAEVDGLTLPINLEAVGTSRQRVQRGAVVDDGIEILVFTVGSNDSPGGFWRRASATCGPVRA